MALGADVIFLGLDVVDEYVATPENAGMPNAVKRESRDNLILSY